MEISNDSKMDTTLEPAGTTLQMVSLCPCGSHVPFEECHGKTEQLPSAISVIPVTPCPCGSGKGFLDCHGANGVKLVQPRSTVKLDLACGQSPREGYEGVDLPGVPGVKHELNLMKFPWPWADSSISEVYCSHFIEHIPMQHVDDAGNYVPEGTPGAKDLFFRFFDEIFRILEPGGWIEIIAPNARSNRGYQDPTHRRFIVAETFLYLNKPWRDLNKLDHYNVLANFGVESPSAINPGIWDHYVAKLKPRTDEVKQEILNERWNVIADWHAKLQSLKT